MYRRISVHLDQGFDCKRRTQAAIGLAKRHQAELVGIYATPPAAVLLRRIRADVPGAECHEGLAGTRPR